MINFLLSIELTSIVTLLTVISSIASVFIIFFEFKKEKTEEESEFKKKFIKPIFIISLIVIGTQVGIFFFQKKIDKKNTIANEKHDNEEKEWKDSIKDLNDSIIILSKIHKDSIINIVNNSKDTLLSIQKHYSNKTINVQAELNSINKKYQEFLNNKTNDLVNQNKILTSYLYHPLSKKIEIDRLSFHYNFSEFLSDSKINKQEFLNHFYSEDVKIEFYYMTLSGKRCVFKSINTKSKNYSKRAFIYDNDLELNLVIVNDVLELTENGVFGNIVHSMQEFNNGNLLIAVSYSDKGSYILKAKNNSSVSYLLDNKTRNSHHFDLHKSSPIDSKNIGFLGVTLEKDAF